MMADVIDKDLLLRVVPAQIKKNISDDVLDVINGHLASSETRELFRENIISFASVLQEGRFKFEDYVSAVKYVSFKMLGDSNVVAYTKTFPDRYSRLINEGSTDKEISAYVAAYHKTKLVTLIFGQTLMPVHILHNNLFHESINTMAEIMRDSDTSPKVRSDTAYNLATLLKPPEEAKIKLDVNLKEDSAISALKETTMELVRQQREMVQSGLWTAQTVAHSGLIIEGEVEDDA